MSGVLVGTERFVPVQSNDNDTMFVIQMNYQCNYDVRISRSRTFTVTWAGGLDGTRLFHEEMPVLRWLEELEVHEFALDAAIHYTLLALEELVEELLEATRVVGPTRRRSLGLRVTIIRVLDLDQEEPGLENQDYSEPLEPEYLDDEEEVVSKRTVKKALAESGVTFVEVRGDKYDGGCAICLEELKGVDVAVLTCSHVLHGECLIPWILKGGSSNPTCPLCRSPILASSVDYTS